MKPASFDYVAPASLEEAVGAMATGGGDAKVLAGGQSLIPMLALRLARPTLLVDINRLPGLDGIREASGLLEIGALVRQRALERWAATRSPLFAEVLRHVAHPPIRNRGTVVGNVVHADPASELPAVMVALEAEMAVASRAGSRAVPAGQFFTGPLTTALRPDEMLTEIRIPAPPPRTGGAFVEMARRAGDFALVGVAALITLDGAGTCERVRIALCGVGPTPIRARAAEDALTGQAPTATALAAAADRAAAATSPPSDVHGSAEFRKKLARHFARQAIAAAVERSGGR
jgi:aerobic carbon-monoxide dehydrogenase medium subunit